MKARQLNKRIPIKKYRNTINGLSYIIKDGVLFMTGNTLTISSFKIESMPSLIQRGVFIAL